MDYSETFVPISNGSWYWELASLSFYNYGEVVAFGVAESISDVFVEMNKVKKESETT